MQVYEGDEKKEAFEPRTIHIVIDSEEEYDTLLTLFRTNSSVPAAISRGGCQKDLYSEKILYNFMGLFRKVLAKD